MNDKQYEVYLSSQTNRPKELAPYELFIKIKLDEFPGTSASQMHDWLKEYDVNFPAVNPKTVYNFVMWVRQEYNIPKIKQDREYFIVGELPFGKQSQVDFGEYNMRASTGGRKKVYFFTMVLSRSRYKYIYFSDTPFTSSLAIKGHLGKELCRHRLSVGKGETIKNNDHKRDKSQKVNQMIINIAEKFDFPSKAVEYFELLRAAKPRYIRDQILLVKECFSTFSAEAVNNALEFCLDKQVYSASDFKSVATKIQQELKQGPKSAKNT